MQYYVVKYKWVDHGLVDPAAWAAPAVCVCVCASARAPTSSCVVLMSAHDVLVSRAYLSSCSLESEKE